MKRIIPFALALALVFGFTACSNTADSSSDTTTTPEVEGTAPEVEDDMGVTPETDNDADADTDADAANHPYADILASVRPAEYNDVFMIISPAAGGEGFDAIHGYSAEYDDAMLQSEVTDILSPVLGFDFALAQDYAFSVSPIMTQSYGAAIFMPAEGNTDAIVAGLEAYVANQRAAFENYLPDQYEIASAATVTVMDSGEVVLVCSENGAEMLADIEAALKG